MANSEIPALAVDGIDAFYGDSHVLHGVGFGVAEGGLLAMLGRNGAGKSTCMSTVIGFLRPRHGSIRLFGQAIAGLSPEAIAHKGVSIVPQGRRVFPTLSVKENLLVARHGTGAWSLDRVFKLFPRLSERRTQTAGLLSGGEQQMLAIGRALVGNPRVLLMDEPSEGLAPQIVAEVARVIADLAKEGLSIVLVEQNVKLALSIASNVVILNTGRVVFNGSTDEAARDQTVINRHLGVF